eukprot:4328003-Prymnesium_polylepis.1
MVASRPVAHTGAVGRGPQAMVPKEDTSNPALSGKTLQHLAAELGRPNPARGRSSGRLVGALRSGHRLASSGHGCVRAPCTLRIEAASRGL